MNTLKTSLITLGIVVLSLISGASAQYDTPNNQKYIQEAIDYYRYHTGDYSTPDQQAMGLGAQLWCSHNPGVCEAALNPASYTQSNSGQVGQINSDILDIQHNGYIDRSEMQYQGHQKSVQEGIYGTTTFVNPNDNTGYSDLPVNAHDGMIMQTPHGQNVMFDQASQSWFLLDMNGLPVQQLQYGF